ncbi:hypothetical protein J4217_03165 [Candidatus Pacearchaeota archaeon]|nr:hypothetical protein [Candidatus Pacearchaeota archaeon]
MAVEGVINASGDIIAIIGQVGLWVKAAGIFIILWVIFQSIVLWFNWRRIREIYKIKADMKRMESKLDMLLEKK